MVVIGLVVSFIILGLIIWGLTCLVKSKFDDNEIIEKNCEANETALKQLSEAGFIVSNICYIKDIATVNCEDTNENKIICIDAENNKLALIDYDDGSLIIADFSELISYEIYENGGAVSTGAALGTGIGALYSTNTKQMSNDLKLIIRLNRFDKSQVIYNIISNTMFKEGIEKSSDTYKKIISSLQNAVSKLELISHRNK